MATRDPLSFQLYSLRNFPPVRDQLTLLKGLGYTNVEPFAGLYADLDGLERGLKETGLTARSGHFNLADVERDPHDVATTARRLGTEIVVVPYLQPGERPTDRAGWAEMGQRLARAGDAINRAGLRFAYHNHDFEFRALPDGTMPIELMLSDGVLWEADLAWIAKAGADPEPWLRRYAGRVPLVHVKDIAPPGEKADEDGWADVGTGTLGWGRLWDAAVEAGAETMIAEHDNPSDGARFARASAAAMSGYNEGRH